MKRLALACIVILTQTLPATPQTNVPAEDVVAFILFGAEDKLMHFNGLSPWKRLEVGNFEHQQQSHDRSFILKIKVTKINNCKFTITKTDGTTLTKTSPMRYDYFEQDVDFSKIGAAREFKPFQNPLYPGLPTTPRGTTITMIAPLRPGAVCGSPLDAAGKRLSTQCLQQEAPFAEIPVLVRAQDLKRLQDALAYLRTNYCPERPY